MGKVLTGISGHVANVGATLTALTVNAGDSLTVKSFFPPSKCHVVTLWGNQQAQSNLLQIKAPSFHDNVNGSIFAQQANTRQIVSPLSLSQTVESQETIAYLANGTAVAGDVQTAHLALFYENLQGAEQKLITYDEMVSRKKYLTTVQVNITLGVVTGEYTGNATINSLYDQFKANTDYAILGYTTTEAVANSVSAVRISGADFSGYPILAPVNSLNPQMTENFFVDLSKAYGVGLIPVFNSANKASTIIDMCSNENGTTATITFILAMLK
jgi:hypothetical protein